MQTKRKVVNLPLHGGKAPKWLFNRMVKLSEGVLDVILYEYGPDEFLRRICNPHWFQAFSCVLGFDWHSSGTTTTTCGALKMAVKPGKHGMIVAEERVVLQEKLLQILKLQLKYFLFPPKKLII